MKEVKRIKEAKIEYRFKIHAYRLEKDGKYDENGVEVEHTKSIFPFNWSNVDYQGAYDHAVDVGMTSDFFPKYNHFYDHWAE